MKTLVDFDSSFATITFFNTSTHITRNYILLHIKQWSRRRRNFTRHPITGLNFNKNHIKTFILVKPYTKL
jgi:hypothetical protein